MLHYIHSTHDQGITFSSRQGKSIHTFLHQPDTSNVEAYDDATHPAPGRREHLTTYSDACWGSQIGNSVKAGTLLPLWKFCSMSGAIVFRLGGPIAWKAIRQEQTSLSSCEAEIYATSKGATLSVDVRNLATNFSQTSKSLPDATTPTKVYNDNMSCVNWANNLTTKGIRHIQLRET